MKNHYEGIREMSGGDIGGFNIRLRPSGPVSGMNADVAGPGDCPTCGGYKKVKVQSGFGEVCWYDCGDCNGTGKETSL